MWRLCLFYMLKIFFIGEFPTIEGNLVAIEDITTTQTFFTN